MSFLDPANAQVHYDNLKAAAQKLPANPEVLTLKNLINSLAPFVGQGTPKLGNALESYIEASRAILLNNTAPGNKPEKRKETPISKALGNASVYANNLLAFCPEDGDDIIDEILKQIIVVSESLKS